MGVVKKVKSEFFWILRTEGGIPPKDIERLEQLMSNMENFSDVGFEKLIDEMVTDES